MLSELRRDGYRTGVFTHATRRAAAVTLAGTGLDRFQLTTVCGDEIEEQPATGRPFVKVTSGGKGLVGHAGDGIRLPPPRPRRDQATAPGRRGAP